MSNKEKAIELHKQGKKRKEIAEILGLNYQTVCAYFRPKVNNYKLHRRWIATIKGILSNKFYRFTYRVKNKHSVPHEKLEDFNYETLLKLLGDNPKCYLTGEPINLKDASSYAFDHKIPASKNGDNSLENLGLCTRLANRVKTDLTPNELIDFCIKVLENFDYKVIDTLDNQHPSSEKVI